MKLFKIFSIFILIAAVTGCSVANQYDYQNANVSLPLSGDGELGVGVLDKRSYVLLGEQDPDVIGVRRVGFAKPIDVTTVSGQSVTEDMADSLEAALRNAGYSVSSLQFSSPYASIVASTISEHGKQKNIVLTVSEWKMDFYLNLTLHFNLFLQVISKDGTTIAKNYLQGDEIIDGGGRESQHARTAVAAFETQIGRLFNNEDIIEALKN